MTAILRDTSGKMHHGILFDRRLLWNGYERVESGIFKMAEPEETR